MSRQRPEFFDMRFLSLYLLVFFGLLQTVCATNDKTSARNQFVKALSKIGTEERVLENKLFVAIVNNNTNNINQLLNGPAFDMLATAQPKLITLFSVKKDNYIVLDALQAANMTPQFNFFIDNDGSTGLFTAIYRGDINMVKYLLKHGIDVFRINISYKTAIDEGLIYAQPDRLTKPVNSSEGTQKSKKDCVIEILKYLKSEGLFDVYSRWEENLSELRVGQMISIDSNRVPNLGQQFITSETFKEKSLLQEFQKLQKAAQQDTSANP